MHCIFIKRISAPVGIFSPINVSLVSEVCYTILSMVLISLNVLQSGSAKWKKFNIPIRLINKMQKRIIFFLFYFVRLMRRKTTDTSSSAAAATPPFPLVFKFVSELTRYKL